jgi:hypothetical protein
LNGSQTVSSQPPSRPLQWFLSGLKHKVARKTEVEAIHGIEDVDFPSPLLTWLPWVLRLNLLPGRTYILL